jgi:8-oxo-dGTP pyrophosphatase MutT (NUDIX family)
MDLKRRLYGLVGRQLQWIYARLFRAMTLGVQVLIIDPENRVLLVKHTYSYGWHFPGGGVERGETIAQAAMREAREEAGIVASDYKLIGLFSQEAAFSGDHVALFVVRDFTRISWQPDGEIEAAQFYALTDLPTDITEASRRRLDEFIEGKPISEHW